MLFFSLLVCISLLWTSIMSELGCYVTEIYPRDLPNFHHRSLHEADSNLFHAYKANKSHRHFALSPVIEEVDEEEDTENQIMAHDNHHSYHADPHRRNKRFSTSSLETISEEQDDIEWKSTCTTDPSLRHTHALLSPTISFCCFLPFPFASYHPFLYNHHRFCSAVVPEWQQQQQLLYIPTHIHPHSLPFIPIYICPAILYSWKLFICSAGSCIWSDPAKMGHQSEFEP